MSSEVYRIMARLSLIRAVESLRSRWAMYVRGLFLIATAVLGLLCTKKRRIVASPRVIISFWSPLFKRLEKRYSRLRDKVWLRTDPIDFLAVLSSLNHHELSKLQQSHNGDVKLFFVWKIEVVWPAWSPFLKFLSAWITAAYALRMTYSRMIGNVQLRSGFIDSLAARSLNCYEISNNIHNMVVSRLYMQTRRSSASMILVQHLLAWSLKNSAPPDRHLSFLRAFCLSSLPPTSHRPAPRYVLLIPSHYSSWKKYWFGNVLEYNARWVAHMYLKAEREGLDYVNTFAAVLKHMSDPWATHERYINAWWQWKWWERNFASDIRDVVNGISLKFFSMKSSMLSSRIYLKSHRQDLQNCWRPCTDWIANRDMRDLIYLIDSPHFKQP